MYVNAIYRLYMYACILRASPVAHGKESVCSAGDEGDMGSITELGRSPGGGHGNPLQSSCLGSPTDRGAWWATVHRVTKSQTQLKRLTMSTYILGNQKE